VVVVGEVNSTEESRHMATIMGSDANSHASGADRETLTTVNLKLTPAQAVRLWRLLGEPSTGTYGPGMKDDLNHADIWGVWEQLEDTLAESGTPRQSYAEMVEEAKQPASR
jgi:hypothetical protein